jgi:regulator of protease activity HflC (stomatin/prohibitin superfamily)
VLTEGVEELRNIIAERTLDQLFAADDPDAEPRIEVEAAIRSRLEKRVHAKGATLLGVNLGILHPPDSVVDQRIKTWQAEWERRQMVTVAEAKAESERRRDIARGVAQLEMIQSLTQSFQSESGTLSKDLVTFRMIQALERMMSTNTPTEGKTNDETRQTLHSLRETLANLKSASKGM